MSCLQELWELMEFQEGNGTLTSRTEEFLNFCMNETVEGNTSQTVEPSVTGPETNMSDYQYSSGYMVDDVSECAAGFTAFKNHFWYILSYPDVELPDELDNVHISLSIFNDDEDDNEDEDEDDYEDDDKDDYEDEDEDEDDYEDEDEDDYEDDYEDDDEDDDDNDCICVHHQSISIPCHLDYIYEHAEEYSRFSSNIRECLVAIDDAWKTQDCYKDTLEFSSSLIQAESFAQALCYAQEIRKVIGHCLNPSVKDLDATLRRVCNWTTQIQKEATRHRSHVLKVEDSARRAEPLLARWSHHVRDIGFHNSFPVQVVNINFQILPSCFQASFIMRPILMSAIKYELVNPL